MLLYTVTMDTLVKQSQPVTDEPENEVENSLLHFEILDTLRYEQIDLEHVDVLISGNFTRSTDYPFW